MQIMQHCFNEYFIFTGRTGSTLSGSRALPRSCPHADMSPTPSGTCGAEDKRGHPTKAGRHDRTGTVEDNNKKQCGRTAQWQIPAKKMTKKLAYIILSSYLCTAKLVSPLRKQAGLVAQLVRATDS